MTAILLCNDKTVDPPISSSRGTTTSEATLGAQKCQISSSIELAKTCKRLSRFSCKYEQPTNIALEEEFQELVMEPSSTTIITHNKAVQHQTGIQVNNTKR